jgi:ADP-ribose pyrophosphatase YjhB (NUDIX family)
VQLENLDDDVSVKDLADYPRYLIRNPQGDYWSNDWGWVDYASADIFSHLEKERFDLPSEGQWVPLAESRPVIGFPGNDLKALLGEDFVNKADAFLQEQGMLCLLEWHPQGRRVGQAQAAGQALTARLSLNSADSQLLRREGSLKLLDQLRESVRGFLPKSAESRVRVVPQRPQYDRWNDRWNLELVVLEASEDDLESKEVYFDDDPPEFAAPQGLSPEGERARQIIVQVLRRNGDLDSRGQKHVFYTPEQWALKADEHVKDGVLVVVHDGGSHAPYFHMSYAAELMLSRMDLALRREGFQIYPYAPHYSVIAPVEHDEANQWFVRQIEDWFQRNPDPAAVPGEEPPPPAATGNVPESLEDDDDVNWKDLQLPLDKEAAIRHVFRQAGLKITSIQEVPEDQDWGELGHAQRIIVTRVPPNPDQPWTTDINAWEAVDEFCLRIKSALYEILDTDDIEWLRNWGLEDQAPEGRHWYIWWYIGDPDIKEEREMNESDEDDFDVKDYSDDIPQSDDFQAYLLQRGFRKLSGQMGDYFKKLPAAYARVRVYQYPNYVSYLLGLKEGNHWFKLSEMTNAYRVLSVLQQRGLFDVREGLDEEFGADDDPELYLTPTPNLQERWNQFEAAWRSQWALIQRGVNFGQRTAYLEGIMPSHLRWRAAFQEVQRLVYEHLGGGRIADFKYHRDGYVLFHIYDLGGVVESEAESEADDVDWKEISSYPKPSAREVREAMKRRGIVYNRLVRGKDVVTFLGWFKRGQLELDVLALLREAAAEAGLDQEHVQFFYMPGAGEVAIIAARTGLLESEEDEDFDTRTLKDVSETGKLVPEIVAAMIKNGVIHMMVRRPWQPPPHDLLLFMGLWQAGKTDQEAAQVCAAILRDLRIPITSSLDDWFNYMPGSGDFDLALPAYLVLDWERYVVESQAGLVQKIIEAQGTVLNVQVADREELVTIQGEWKPGATVQALAEAISVDANRIQYDAKNGEFTVLATRQALVQEDQADGKASDTKRVAIVAVFRQKQDDPAYECLVCKREGPPAEGEWVIPGGHAEEGEEIKVAARRELQEEAHVDLGDLTFVKTMPNETGDLEVHVFGAILPEGERAKAGDDAEKVKWLPLDDLPKLSLDNDNLIREVAEAMELQRLPSVDESLPPRLADQIRSKIAALKPRRASRAGMSFEVQQPEGFVDRLIEGIEREAEQLQADAQPELRLMDLIEDAYSQTGTYLFPDDQQDVERLARVLVPLFKKPAGRRIKESADAPPRYGTVTDEVVPALEQALVEIFGQRYDWLVPHVIQHMDPEISLIAMEGDRVIGFYILGRRSILDGVKSEHLKPTEDLKPYRQRQGIEGVALGIVPDRRGTGLGSRFKDYPQTLGADYMWGLQMHDLDNLSHWLKRRRIVARNPEMVATLQDFKPGAVAEASEEDFEAKDLEDDLLNDEHFQKFAQEHGLLYHPGAKMVRDVLDNVYGSIWFKTGPYLNREATVRQWTQVFSDYFKIDPARMKVAYYPPSGDIMVMVTNLVL